MGEDLTAVVRRFLPAILSLFLGAALASPAAADPPACPADARWGVVIDAGSSGSRLRLFCWRPDAAGGLPWIEDLGSRKREPGIADAGCTRTPGEAVALLRPLIDDAREAIGEARLPRTPLSLLATAGLRRCPETYRSRMLEGLRDYLADLPFASAQAEVISGRDEGRFGWITVNYLEKRLGQSATVGALDLGGVSTQITFAPGECRSERGECGELELGGASYPLYSHSYLGWGQDEAMRRVGSRACYLRGYPGEGFTGRGRYGACKRAIRKTLREELRERPPEPPCPSSCTRLGAYQPPLRGDFVAFSAYAYTTDSLGLPPTLSLAQLEAAGQAYCRTRWRQIQAECAAGRRTGCKDWWLNRYCFAAAYIVTLLHEVYGFPMEERITSTNELRGIEIDWTLGAMVQLLLDGGPP